MAPRFSIVIPVYNRALQVREALESVAAQTFQDFECIVVDDGSSDADDLLDVVSSLQDARFRVIHQENAGGGAARNTGIRLSRGPFVCFLDSDDCWMPSKLERVSQAIAANPEVDLWMHRARMERGHQVYLVRPTRLPRPDETLADLMFRHREFMQTSTITIRREFAKSVLFDPSLEKAQDVDFLLRLEGDGARFACLDAVLSVWNDRVTGGRIGASRKPESVQRWYDAYRHCLTPSLARAFEATYLSYEISTSSPARAGGYILRALMTGAISGRMAVKSAMRAYIPQTYYRAIADKFMIRERETS